MDVHHSVTNQSCILWDIWFSKRRMSRTTMFGGTECYLDSFLGHGRGLLAAREFLLCSIDALAIFGACFSLPRGPHICSVSIVARILAVPFSDQNQLWLRVRFGGRD